VDSVQREGARCRALADGMSFRFLFDEARELLSTGYNVSNARLDTSYYDLLASEARLASLVAVAKGDAPQKHWFRLARPRARVDSRRALLSWSGSMFEYLMPLLVTQSSPRTLLDEAMRGAVARQRTYGSERGVPWGISESAYNVMDLEMTYQYRAFGVPGLGLKAGLAEDLVVTPYATALAALVDPIAAARNFRALAREGLDGQFGFFEAIDYSPSRLPPGKRGVVVRSFMAHHHGMTLVALDNTLHDRRVQRLFHADPRIKASELLLEERIPTGVELLKVPDAALAAPVRHAPDLDLSERMRLEEGAPLRVHLMGHGALSTLVTNTGAGSLTWKGIDINRFREDAVFDGGGIYAYVRNLSAYRMWSAAYHPARGKASNYEAAFFIDRVELRRRDGAVETITEIVPSAEHPAEVRRFTLKNHGDEPCEVELTTFTELALASHGADVAHRAFSSLFIETEALPEQGAVIAHRRPRTAGEPSPWVAQVLTPEDEGFSEVDFDTSRADFVGRGGMIERPRALAKLESRLSRRTGAVLDAALVLRRRVHLAPGHGARVTLATLMADTREELLRLIATYAAPQAIPRAFELGLADARVELRHLGVTAAQAHRFQRFLSAVIFPDPALRAPLDPALPGSGGQRALSARGLSGDLPIVVLVVDHPDFDDLFRELILAHEYFRVNGVRIDLVVLNEEPSIYLQPLYEHALDIVRAAQAEGRLNQAGGIFLRRASHMEEGDKRLLLATARTVFTASGGSLARQLRRVTRRRELPGPHVPTRPAEPHRSLPPPPREELLFDNGIGGFSADGREYVMTLNRETHTPAPWCNVIANPSFGTLVSESGSSFTWSRNSQRRRLTPWSNDALLDPSGELIYLRDDEDGSVWTPTPRPAGGSATYRVAHGQGYTRFLHDRMGLLHDLTVFVSSRDPVRFQRLRVENRGTTTRRLSIYGVVEWLLGTGREKGRLSVATQWDPAGRVCFATNPFAAPSGTAFFAATAAVKSFTGNREEFFGVPGSRRWPQALRRESLSGQAGAGLDPCAALQSTVMLAAGEAFEITFVLGDASGPDEARALSVSYADNASVAQAFEETRAYWDKLLTAVTIKTPDQALDVLMNRWVLYQALSCRIWARSGFYQSSGAYGFRDQLQDVLCLVHTLPAAAREHILRAASRQFVEGDVQHWWHPEAGDGVRTRCSDDKLWLPYVVAEYVRVTNDRAVLDERVPFLAERLLTAEDDDLYSTPGSASETAPLYEHCVRAIESSFAVGTHGLPLMGVGDWNDGMNRIGAGGQGESVFMAWFLVKTLRDFAPLAVARRDTARATRWLEHAGRLTEAADVHAWDGAWYKRAYFDDGTPVGSRASTECRIDALAQSWAVIAGTGDRRRAARAVLESERLLLDDENDLMLLLTPPFSGAPPDPGYIASYPPGIRENGGQYTHGALFTLRALALLDEGERAGRLLEVLNPIRHALTAQGVERYKVEPYVVAADVYSGEEHEGRGGWTWYTGSAGWFYRVVLEDILGIRREGDRITVSPCLPRSWPGFEVTYRVGGSAVRIVVTNVESLAEEQRPKSPVRATPLVRLVDEGRVREVRLFVGERHLRSSA
jgi:cyclic beta-1,2-glucan synthetase